MQLPLFNEMYVAARLLDAIAQLDYPRDKLEIQVLDDSTDETQAICRAKVDELAATGLDIQYIHRTDRTGFKAGALEHGLKIGARRVRDGVRRRLPAAGRTSSSAPCTSSPTTRSAWCRCAGIT